MMIPEIPKGVVTLQHRPLARDPEEDVIVLEFRQSLDFSKSQRVVLTMKAANDLGCLLRDIFE